MTTANGIPCTTMRITVPWSGPMLVQATAGEEVKPLAGVVVFDMMGLTASATLLPGRAGMFAGNWQGMAIGGRGGWRKSVPAKGYRSPVGLLSTQIFADAAREVGELPPRVTKPKSVGGFYTRAAGVASDVFALLAPGDDWWVDSSGLAVVGTRAPTFTSAPYDLLEYEPWRGRLVISTDTPSAFIPGVGFFDANAGTFQINSVVWTATQSKLRGEIWTA